MTVITDYIERAEKLINDINKLNEERYWQIAELETLLRCSLSTLNDLKEDYTKGVIVKEFYERRKEEGYGNVTQLRPIIARLKAFDVLDSL